MPGLNLHAIYLTVIGVLLLAAGLGAWYWHHETLIEGEDKILATDRAAVAKQEAAVQAQDLQDQEDAADATASLNSELTSLRAQLADRSTAGAAPGVTHSVRCFARSGGAVPGAAAAAGSAQPPNAGPANVAAVPSGATDGPDIGPGLSLLATAGAVAAAQQRACVALSLKESAPP